MKISLESTAARPSFSISRTVIFARSNSVKKSVMPANGLAAIAGRGAREQQHVGGLLGVGVPHLAAVHDEAVAVALGARLDP